MPNVSYSETSSYQLCKRKHWYGYTRSLQKATTSTGLALGSAGHKILEAYYAVILAAGDSREEQKAAMPEALVAARAMHTQIMEEGFSPADNRATLEEILFEFYFPNEPLVNEGYLIQAVEMEFKLDVQMEDDGQTYGTVMVVDLICVDRGGRTVIVDHKFLYNFNTYEDAELAPQIPLYIAGLRGLGYKIDYGLYNMVRTMVIKGTKDKKTGTYPGATLEQRLKSLELKPNGIRVARTFSEQIDTAQEITRAKMLPLEVQDLRAHRTANKMVCNSCDFKDLCVSDLQGGNSELLIKAAYKLRERKVFADSLDAEEVSA